MAALNSPFWQPQTVKMDMQASPRPIEDLTDVELASALAFHLDQVHILGFPPIHALYAEMGYRIGRADCPPSAPSP